jgi:hypothetical protein
MCIMEVRAGQRASTIAQACAHNTTTVERDLDMFVHLLDHRGEEETARALRRAGENLQRAYADLVEIFGELARREEDAHGVHFTAGRPPGHDGTHEATRHDHEYDGTAARPRAAENAAATRRASR